MLYQKVLRKADLTNKYVQGSIYSYRRRKMRRRRKETLPHPWDQGLANLLFFPARGQATKTKRQGLPDSD